ncbi:MAG: zinc ribbon domain-containing protein [Coriobacteriia bacterium]|nr:zinc ribbon domain-containing protein [Coriobacteriia bacterium]
MICKTCSQENANDAKFCIRCGTALSDQSVQQAQQAYIPQQYAYGQVQQPQQPYGQQQAPGQQYGKPQAYPGLAYQQQYGQVQQPSPAKKNRVPIIIAGGLALIAVGLLVAVLVNTFGNKSSIVGTYRISAIKTQGVTISGLYLEIMYPEDYTYIEIVDSNTMEFSILGVSEVCTYTRNGDTLYMSIGYETIEIQISGDELSFEVDDMLYIFKKK